MIRVAVVDDEALVRRGLTVLLRMEPDIDVVGEAGDGDAAVALVRREHPDVVLMDIRMPRTDGLTATRTLLADPATAATRVLVLTTFDLDEHVFAALRAAWLPKVTRGWFFRAESFFSVARYLDDSAMESRKAGLDATPPDFLSHSHGEGFLRFFQERCQHQGIFIFDEPESPLSPSRQVEFLQLLRAMDGSKKSWVNIATHSPMLMAYPGAALLRLTP